MRALLRIGLLLPCCLVACAEPTSELTSDIVVGGAYRVDFITPPEGVLAVAALDINEHGQVAGNAVGPSGPDGFTWSARDGFVTLARVATADFMSAFAINKRGVVAGNAEWSDGTSHPVIWVDPASPQELGIDGTANDINDRGHVVGGLITPVQQAYLWTPAGGVTVLGSLGGPYSVAYGMNDRDEVVGTSELPDGTFHAFVWSKGRMIDLGALGGSYSEGYAINDAGEVTGIYQRGATETRV